MLIENTNVKITSVILKPNEDKHRKNMRKSLQMFVNCNKFSVLPKFQILL